MKLIELLNQWPRQQIAKALLQNPEPEFDQQSALLNGQLAATLGAASRRGDNPRRGKLRRGATSRNFSKITDVVGHARAVGYFDQEFPPLLKVIPDPPLVLFYVGELSLLAAPCIAIVGARKCTTQGKQNAQTLARDLALRGVHVLSGLALGIDGAAHRGALQAGGPGQTVAFLGSGLQRLYPHRHGQLAEQIVASGGLLLSEYPAGKDPRPHQFPERNRLISGASLATVVVEASERSGSLITARFAAEQGRDVLAMPGSINSFVSVGSHRLIQQGAGLVTCADEVIENAGLEAQPVSADQDVAATVEAISETGQAILSHLQGYAVSLDELLLLTAVPAAELTGALVELELHRFVEQGPLGYIRTSKILM